MEIHLYGSLRRHAPDPRPDRESGVRLEPRPGETVGTVLEQLFIASTEVYCVFLNGALLFTHNSMTPWLVYQQAGARDQGLDTPLQPSDRLGLLASDMGMLVV
jgi:hypothetical protein